MIGSASTQEAQLTRRSNGTYEYPHTGRNSEVVRMVCCEVEQACKGVYPEHEPRIPSFCLLCGKRGDPFIDPHKDMIERIAQNYELDYDVADWLFKAFRHSDYLEFSKFYEHLVNTGGLKSPESLVSKTSKGIRTGKTIHLHNTQQATVSVTCNDCLTTFRVIRVVPTVVGAARYCMICGSDHVRTYSDEEADYYEAIAIGYETTVENIKLIIEVFGHSRHIQFAEFVAEHGGVATLTTLCTLYQKSSRGFSSFESWLEALKAGVK